MGIDGRRIYNRTVPLKRNTFQFFGMTRASLPSLPLSLRGFCQPSIQLSLFFRLLDSFSESYLNGVGSILGHSNALVYACYVCNVCKALSRMLRHGMVRYCRMIMCVCICDIMIPFLGFCWFHVCFVNLHPDNIYICTHVCNYSSYVIYT